ncbi:MAG TPA: hypothetical protein VEI83_16705 [Acidimicrobiales bacterium]|nr:hypothetical protein [Acidimicrobiales bacterium]
MALAGAILALLVVTGPAGASATVTTPPGPYADDHVITVSGQGFATLASGATIQILMCADPGGTAAGLPRDNSSCDGTTLSPNTIYPTVGGGFSDRYSIVKLTAPAPNSITCDATHYCVLWIGEDYVNQFAGSAKSPIAFSQPFLVGAPSQPSGSSSSTLVASVAVIAVLVAAGTFLLYRRNRRPASVGATRRR